MSYYVCKGAKLKCSMGDQQSDLGVIHPVQTVYLHGGNMANIMDYKPMMNIKPFGQCKSMANPTVAAATAANYGKLQPMPCMPNTTSSWMNGKTNTFVRGQQTLMNDCKLMCAWAGMIEVTEEGQEC